MCFQNLHQDVCQKRKREIFPHKDLFFFNFLKDLNECFKTKIDAVNSFM